MGVDPAMGTRILRRDEGRLWGSIRLGLLGRLHRAVVGVVGFMIREARHHLRLVGVLEVGVRGIGNLVGEAVIMVERMIGTGGGVRHLRGWGHRGMGGRMGVLEI